MSISHLPFKGSRDYLHGTDIYEWLAGELRAQGGEEPAEITITFHQMSFSQLSFVLEGEPALASATKIGEVAASFGTRKVRVPLLSTDQPVTNRVDYQEEQIVAACAFHDKEVSLTKDLSFRIIELVVAMTKALHLYLFPGQKKGWLFVRIELSRLLESRDKDKLKVAMVQYIETRFSKSEVWSGTEKLGSIYFSVRSS